MYQEFFFASLSSRSTKLLDEGLNVLDRRTVGRMVLCGCIEDGFNDMRGLRYERVE